MKIILRLSLQRAMQHWIDSMCDTPDRPDGYIHPELNEQMAAAAEQVFDAAFDSQAFAQKEDA